MKDRKSNISSSALLQEEIMLANKVKLQEHEAIKTFEKRFMEIIKAICSSYFKDQNIARQESTTLFTDIVMEKIKSYRGDSLIHTWMMPVVNNYCINQRKKMIREKTVPLDENMASTIPDDRIDLEQRNIDESICRKVIWKVLNDFYNSVVYKKIFIYYWTEIEDRQYSDISDLNGISNSRVSQIKSEINKRIEEDIPKIMKNKYKMKDADIDACLEYLVKDIFGEFMKTKNILFDWS